MNTGLNKAGALFFIAAVLGELDHPAVGNLAGFDRIFLTTGDGEHHARYEYPS